MFKRLSPEQVLCEGKKVIGWSCNLVKDGKLKVNGGVQQIIKWEGEYYYLASDRDNRIVCPEDFGKIDVKEAIEISCWDAVKYIVKEIEEDTSVIMQGNHERNRLFDFLRSQAKGADDSVLMFIDLEAIGDPQKISLILSFPSFIQILRRRKIVFVINKFFETSQNIKILKCIQGICPQAVFPIDDPSQLIKFLRKMKVRDGRV